MKKTFAQILQENSLGRSRSMALKVPLWAECPGLEYPTELCTQQCSSEYTASYKASIVAAPGVRRIADLTGGLGIDSWFFAREICGRQDACVLHNEMDITLSDAVRSNFGKLRSHGFATAATEFSSVEITEDTIDPVLESFKPDTVFMDPARRSASGSKVFRLRECSPDVLRLEDAIFRHCSRLILKLSPMADIAQIISELEQAAPEGIRVTQMHIIGAGGECKELLAVMEKSDVSVCLITVAGDCRNHSTFLSFTKAEAETSEASFATEEEDLEILFEPCAALRKSGAFNLLSQRFGITKLGLSTHLYAVTKDQYETLSQASGLCGKWFTINNIHSLTSSFLKHSPYAGGRYETSARGLQLTSEQLQGRLGVKNSSTDGTAHLFGVATKHLGNLLLECRLL